MADQFKNPEIHGEFIATVHGYTSLCC